MRAVITGAEGFAGRWLRAWLDRCGDEVFTPKVDVTQRREVLEAVRAARPDAVFHLAAVSVPAFAQADPDQAMAVNAGGTRNVLAAAAEVVPSATVLVTSSASVYAPSEDPLTEDSPTRGDSAYIKSKLAAELACAEARTAGLNVVVARPFNHTGPNQTEDLVVPSLARGVLGAIAAGRRVVAAGNLEVRRDIADVRDVVRAYRALVMEAPSGIYNVCTGRAVLLSDLAQRLAALAGAPELSFEVDPARVRAGEADVVVGDCSRLHRVTGWTPELSMDTTLNDVLSWWRARV